MTHPPFLKLPANLRPASPTLSLTAEPAPTPLPSPTPPPTIPVSVLSPLQRFPPENINSPPEINPTIKTPWIPVSGFCEFSPPSYKFTSFLTLLQKQRWWRRDLRSFCSEKTCPEVGKGFARRLQSQTPLLISMVRFFFFRTVLTFLILGLNFWLCFLVWSATVFGQNLKLEPLPAEKKAMWKREMACLLSVCDYILEFFTESQTLDDGTTMEVTFLCLFQNKIGSVFRTKLSVG